MYKTHALYVHLRPEGMATYQASHLLQLVGLVVVDRENINELAFENKILKKLWLVPQELLLLEILSGKNFGETK